MPTFLQFPTTQQDPDLHYYRLAAANDNRYPVAAICYVSKCLKRLLEANSSKKEARKTRHVTGQAICDALKDSLLEDYGSFAIDVLAQWNIHETNDFGNIIYALIDVGMLSVSPKDSRTDFVDVYDFKTALKFTPEGDVTKEPWPVLDK